MKDNQNTFYNSLIQGLTEAVETPSLCRKRKRTIHIVPVKQYSGKEVRDIRMNAGMSQQSFADYLGVSKKTVEAWECGRNIPAGCASRLLNMFEMNKDLVRDYPFVSFDP